MGRQNGRGKTNSAETKPKMLGSKSVSNASRKREADQVLCCPVLSRTI
jgi:hypothetical protein